MKNTCFRLSEAQKARLVALCVRKEGKLVDITADHEAKPDIFRAHKGYVSGSAGLFSTPGTYGWSGAYGTHFFVSPADELACVFVTNRGDVAGSESYLSLKVEELVFDAFGRKA